MNDPYQPPETAGPREIEDLRAYTGVLLVACSSLCSGVVLALVTISPEVDPYLTLAGVLGVPPLLAGRALLGRTFAEGQQPRALALGLVIGGVVVIALSATRLFTETGGSGMGPYLIH